MYANGFQLAPGEEFIQCPYHEAHLITNAKFSMHLQKCRTAYIKEKGELADFKVCRFDFNHRVPNLEIRQHEKTCPAQYSLLRDLAVPLNIEEESANDQQKSSRTKRPKQKADDDEFNEDWEEECSSIKRPAYDPTEKLKTQVIHYIEPGLTKSERRDRRLENRKKAQFDPSLEIEAKKEPSSEESPRTMKVQPQPSNSSSSSFSRPEFKCLYPEPEVERHSKPPNTPSHKPKLEWKDEDD